MYLSLSLWSLPLLASSFAALSLPDDMASWNQIDAYSIHQRWWTVRDLEKSGAIRHFGAMHGFFSKLNSGKAVVGVAFGSSFVHDFAGCFDTGPERFAELAIIPSPFTYPQPGQNWTATFSIMNQQQNNKCEDGGYMQAVFHTLNQTWPNSRHIFLNNAKGGASLDAIVDASCSSTFTPSDDKVDLVFLDPASAGSSELSVEKLIRKYSKAKSKPVIVMVSNSRQCEFDQMKPSTDGETCPKGCLLKLNKSACKLLDQDPYPLSSERVKEALKLRDRYQELAVYYNVTHIDLYELMRNWTQTPEMLEKSSSASKYEFVSKIYSDWVHFQKCYGYPGGKLYVIERHAQPSSKAWTEAEHFKCDSNVTGAFILADLLVHWINVSQKNQVPGATDQTLPPPMNTKVDESYVTRCYGFSFASLMMSSKDGASNEASHHLKHVAPGDFFGGQIGDKASGFGRPDGFSPQPPLNVEGNLLGEPEILQ